MNSPSLWMLVYDPWRAICCCSSGTLPGGGDVRPVCREPGKATVERAQEEKERSRGEGEKERRALEEEETTKG